MKLFLSVAFLYILVAEVQSLKCYSCLPGQTCRHLEQTCPARVNNCLTLVTKVNYGGIANSSVFKGCNGCPGEFSMDFGIVQSFGKCCSSDLCNNQHSYDENEQPNGLECYGQIYGMTPTTVKCSGIQDRCLKFTIKNGNMAIGVKGCGSKNLCQMVDIPTLGMEALSTIDCCEKSQCNKGANLPGSWIGFFISLILISLSLL